MRESKRCLICNTNFIPSVPRQRICYAEQDRKILLHQYIELGIGSEALREKYGVRDRHAIVYWARKLDIPVKTLSQAHRDLLRSRPELLARLKERGAKRRITSEERERSRRNFIRNILEAGKRWKPEKGKAVWKNRELTIEKIRKRRLRQILPKKETSIERRLASGLEAAGLKIQRNHPIHAPPRGSIVDIVVRERKLAIYCDGCWWHCCPGHFPEAKFEPQKRNLRNDARVRLAISDAGWTVKRFFECQINGQLEGCVREVLETEGVLG